MQRRRHGEPLLQAKVSVTGAMIECGIEFCSCQVSQPRKIQKVVHMRVPQCTVVRRQCINRYTRAGTSHCSKGNSSTINSL